MCIAVPGRVIAVYQEKARVSIWGIEEEINIIFLEDVKVGEWVLIHTGYAIGKIEEQSAKEAQAFLKSLGEH
ncbi:HypC/HybG/HupF family hydrogenase formation chaperone [Sporanaerobium hydrogeniformans]|uniref:HypC/HybG/HupF family hydrogenase formation chaperone n=1 Tax=Sporanaerobium hydrogeniformans TaxID=3072179 RepID=UPI0015D49933|nr:HypC/HybG/HupF family hydrogenase formation chaperone [Sporanaerobium hydrogeniformans]